MIAEAKIMFFFGTRAEAIKLSPIIKLMADSAKFRPVLTVAGAHSTLLQQTMQNLDLEPDFDLQTLPARLDNLEGLAAMIHNLNNVVNAAQPDMIIVIGDTTVTLAGSLCASYHQLPLSHVEAGLRTHDKTRPFPDELQRQLVDVMADLYFAPTNIARHNLLLEHHSGRHIHVTGNTIIDAVQQNLRTDYQSPLLDHVSDKRIILLTVQRPENRGEKLERLLATMKDIVETNDDVQLVYPLYPVPEVMSAAERILDHHERITITQPLPFTDYINLASRSYILVTDSGSALEEASVLRKPVLLLRDKTERPEVVKHKQAKLVGTDPTKIQQAVFELLHKKFRYWRMTRSRDSFGGGKASQRIVNIIEQYLQLK